MTSGTIHTSRSNHFTAVCAGPSASDWIRVICPKSDDSGLPDQFATSWMEASGSVPGAMTGGEKRLESPPGSFPSAHTSTWLTSGRRLSLTSLPEMYAVVDSPRSRATSFSWPISLILSQRS